MITLMVLLTALLIAGIVACIFGAGILICFGDVIVAIIVLTLIIKACRRKK